MSDATQDIYRCTPRQLRGFIIRVFHAGLVPFVRSSPGMGKSSIFRSIANELNLHLIDHRLSTSDPTDLSGLPQFHNGLARFAPFEELFPIASTPIPKGKDGWLGFLDEFNAAPKPVQAASYKLILDHMVGQHPLHERVVLAMAGNLDTDRAITNMISTAMQSRVVHLELEISFKEWMEDVAIAQDYDPRIKAYLSQYKSKLMDFRPDHNEKTFCCPRTWEFVNKLVKDEEVKDSDLPLLAGTITPGVAADFIQHTQVYKELITVERIMQDPLECDVPENASIRWATITHMHEYIEDKTFGPLAEYANRFPLDFRLLFFRGVLIKHKEMRQHPAFTRSMVELSRYLSG